MTMALTNNTYGAWLAAWFDVYKRPHVQPSTVKMIDICRRLHIPDWLKDAPMQSVTAFDLQRALNTVSTSRTRLFVFDIYSGSFRRAAQLGLIAQNPMLLVDKVKHRRKVGSPLSKIELSAFLAKLSRPTRLRPLFLFYLNTGVRRSEALNVQWTDINFDQNTLTVRGTKTEKSHRTIPMSADLAALIRALPRENDYLFNYAPEYVSRKFHRLCPAHKLHDLRHTFATRCLECGISIKVVQAWLGHTRLDTTASIYTHILDAFSRSEINKFRLL